MKKPRTGGSGASRVPWGGTSDGEGAPSHYSLTPLPAFCVRHFVSSWGGSPGASEQRTGALVSDARTRQYAGRSIVPRLLLQHRDIPWRLVHQASNRGMTKRLVASQMLYLNGELRVAPLNIRQP